MERNDAHVREYQRFLCQKLDIFDISIFIIFTLTIGYLIGYSHALYDLLMLLDYLNQKF